MEAGKFLDLVIGESVQNIEKVEVLMAVINDYMNGTPLHLCLQKNGLNYTQFSVLLRENTELLSVFEEAKLYNRGALKERLMSLVYMSAENGSTSDAKWLLERLYPNEYGKQVKHISEEIKDEPEVLKDYINAEYIEEDENQN